MKKEIKDLIYKAITIDTDYISNMLVIHKLLDGIEKGSLLVTKDGIVDRTQIIPKERK
ncbi:hypothetical protein [Vagococcus fluvialis]|uniref:hypothetical protein n=1 Tax=Vagococcus fluvialis TaxID=2738 RepID=UPI001D09B8F4|nr:hypothetical protein [Vagococcus fluvialis]UDM70700.1 hypothetical protein K5L00_11295 [Vagococcus fluvialis]UDM78119.1 hypothetical protein K5K98_06830 [Vagococcus fluvialis]UDM82388.1 hypothetical protein K5K96_13770 [Vagococcus fluvialis]